MKKGLDRAFLEYGIRKPDLEVITALCEKHELNADWVKDSLLSQYHKDEAIYGALYGLNIKNKRHFEELLNNGAFGKTEPKIELELVFTGQVLHQTQKYILRRTYILNKAEKPVESVYLNMNGSVFTYGTATPAAQRAGIARYKKSICIQRKWLMHYALLTEQPSVRT